MELFHVYKSYMQPIHNGKSPQLHCLYAMPTHRQQWQGSEVPNKQAWHGHLHDFPQRSKKRFVKIKTQITWRYVRMGPVDMKQPRSHPSCPRSDMIQESFSEEYGLRIWAKIDGQRRSILSHESQTAQVTCWLQIRDWQSRSEGPLTSEVETFETRFRGCHTRHYALV